MSKAILVIDMPEKCTQCDFCEHQDEGWLWCIPCKKSARAFDKPDWCPLQEVPQKKELYLSINNEKGYCEGYNACINEIMKGSE